MLIQVLNRKFELLTVIHNDIELAGIENFNISEDLLETSTLEFDVSGNADGIDQLQEGNYILTKNIAGKEKLFVIKQITDNHTNVIVKSVFAEEFLTELGDFLAGVDYKGKEINPAVEIPKLLAGTGIATGEISSLKINPVYPEDTRFASKLSVLMRIVELTGLNLFTEVVVSENGIHRSISVKEINKAEGKRFEFDSDLTSIKREVDATSIKTAILPLGKAIEQTEEEKEAGKPVEYVTIKEVSWSTANGDPLDKPVGADILIDPVATEKYGIQGNDGSIQPKVVVVNFGDIEDPKELLLLAHKELEKLATPNTNFTFSANDISAQLAEAGIDEEPVELGDVCYVIDNSVSPPIVEEVIVRHMEGNPDSKDSISIEIGTAPNTLVDKSLSSQIMDTIQNSGILAGSASFGDLTAIKADIKVLKADKADISELNSLSIKTETLEADIASINTLVSGNITSNNIHSSGITSDKLVIADGFIKDAMIETVNAGKINAGEINTNKVTIQSENGGIVIADNTQQFKDKSGKVRIQMGQDAKGEFNFTVLDETGTGILIDHTGIKEGAIADGLIKNDMIGAGEIGGEKININSMINSVNNGTSTINGSKVELDTTGQTLDVAFNSLKSSVDYGTERIEANTTELGVQAGKISTLIKDTTIEKNGQNLKLKDEYSKLEQTVSGINSTVGEHTSQLETVTTTATEAKNIATNAAADIQDITKRVASAETAILQSKDAIELKASKTEVTEAVNEIEVGGRNHFKKKGEYNNTTFNDDYECVLLDYENATQCFTQFRNLDCPMGDFKGKEITISFWAKSPKGKTQMQIYNSNGTPMYPFTSFFVNVTTEWQRFHKTVPVTYNENGSDINSDKIEFWATSFNGVIIKKVQVELGNKVTDWTPSPEDIDSAINSKANASEVYTKAETDSKITVKANEISQSVTNKLNDYATTSSLTQTANSITAKFNSSGGCNLVKNGDFKNGTSDWWSGEYEPNATSRYYELWHDNSDRVMSGTRTLVTRGTNLTSGEQRWDCRKFPVKANTTYTLSFLVASHRTSEVGAYVRGNEWDIIASHSEDVAGMGFSGGKNRQLWRKFILTFNSGNNHQANVNLIVFKSQDDSYTWFTEVMVNEGSQPLPFTPHAEELVNGSTVINADGITVNNGALRVKNNNGETVLSGDSGGNLWVQKYMVVGGNSDGQFEVKNSSDQHIMVLNKNGINVKDGVMNITTGSVTTSGTGYPDGEQRDMCLKAYGTHITEKDYAGSQTTIRKAYYQGGDCTLIAENNMNAAGISYKSVSRPERLTLYRSGGNNLNYSTSINLDGDNGEVQCGAVNADHIYTRNNGNGTNYKVGDDVWIGDVNESNTMRISGCNDWNQAWIRFGGGAKIGYGGGSALDIHGTTYVSGELYCSNWLRAYGDRGLYFQDHGGGWHMWDSSWIRAYNGKGVYTSGTIACSNFSGGDGRYAHTNMSGSDFYVRANNDYGVFYFANTGNLRPEVSKGWSVGSPGYPLHTCHAGVWNTVSDVRSKQNVTYLETQPIVVNEESKTIGEEFYNFFKDRFKPVSYNLKSERVAEDKQNILGFIAQDLIGDPVGEMILDKESIKMYQEQEYQEKLCQMYNDSLGEEEKAKEQVPELSYDLSSYITSIAIALKEGTRKIETLEQENKVLKERLRAIEEKLGL